MILLKIIYFQLKIIKKLLKLKGVFGIGCILHIYDMYKTNYNNNPVSKKKRERERILCTHVPNMYSFI